MEQLIEGSFDNFLNEARSKKVVLFGAGKHLAQALAVMKAYGIDVHRLVDNDAWKWGREVRGIRCEDPAWLYENHDQVVVLITTLHFFAVAEQLEKHQISNYYAFLSFIEQIYDVCKDFSAQIPLEANP